MKLFNQNSTTTMTLPPSLRRNLRRIGKNVRRAGETLKETGQAIALECATDLKDEVIHRANHALDRLDLWFTRFNREILNSTAAGRRKLEERRHHELELSRMEDEGGGMMTTPTAVGA